MNPYKISIAKLLFANFILFGSILCILFVELMMFVFNSAPHSYDKEETIKIVNEF